MKYERTPPIGKVEAEQLFLSADPARISEGLARAVNSIDDWKWLQDKCLSFTYHPDFWVAKNAVVCLGHVARIFETLEIDLVMARLKELEQDPRLMGYIEDTIDDIRMFIDNV